MKPTSAPSLEHEAPSAVVVMGVSGSGKTTIAKALAAATGRLYAEGDDFHSAENIEKMRSGTPLTDDDRWPWLRALGEWMGEHRDEGVVVTCSALKRSYRDLLRELCPHVLFLEVVVGRAELQQRLASRKGHYMPAALLDSQLATLEPLAPDEPGARIWGEGPLADVVARAREALAR